MRGNLRHGPKSIDLVERMFFLRLALPIWGILFLGAVMLLRTGRVDRPTYLVVAWLAAPAIAALFSYLANRFLGGLATAVLGGLNSSGGERHSREYSEQEALVAAGRIADAIDSYRAHLVAFPGDVEARLRLAALLAGPAAQQEAGERLLLETRGMALSSRQETVIGNALIDLYERTGHRHLLKAELARFARLNQGTDAAVHARRHLRQLVEEDHRVT